MPRLTISNHFEEDTISETLLGFIPSWKRVRYLSLSIQYPDGKEEILRFATQNSYKTPYNQDDKFVSLSESKYIGVRATKIQEIVNRLEKEGYYVPTSQLALFMNVRIDRLIMNK